MRRWLLVVIASWVVVTAPISAAGTVVVTTLNVGGGVTRYAVAWTSTAGGAVSANLFDVKAGLLLAVKVVPSAATAPTALYDVTLVDTDSVDLLNGQAADQSATVGKYFVFNPPLIVDSTQQLDVVVANAGNAKLGTVYLWVR